MVADRSSVRSCTAYLFLDDKEDLFSTRIEHENANQQQKDAVIRDVTSATDW